MQYGESIVAVQLGEHSPLDGGGDEGLEGLGAALEEGLDLEWGPVLVLRELEAGEGGGGGEEGGEEGEEGEEGGGEEGGGEEGGAACRLEPLAETARITTQLVSEGAAA